MIIIRNDIRKEDPKSMSCSGEVRDKKSERSSTVVFQESLWNKYPL